jgi:hypothetical protein
VLTGIVVMIYAHRHDVLHGKLNPNWVALDDHHRLKLCNLARKKLSQSTQ